MNESTLTRLKIIVERAVRPVRASAARKRKVREELLAHVAGVFEEEAKDADDPTALARTQGRFGQGRATLNRWPAQRLNFLTDGQQHLLAFLTSDVRGPRQTVWSGEAVALKKDGGAHPDAAVADDGARGGRA